jgi:hypothetical protein
MSEVTEGGAPKTQITVSGIKVDLANGLTRPQIQAKYNLTGKDLKDLFSHPKLKGLKTKPAPSFILTDDEEGIDEAAPITEEEGESLQAVNENNVEVEEEF